MVSDRSTYPQKWKSNIEILGSWLVITLGRKQFGNLYSPAVILGDFAMHFCSARRLGILDVSMRSKFLD